jgi:single-strand DNA-binding protein
MVPQPKKTAWALDPADGSVEHSKEFSMNSFNVTAIGNIGADLELKGTGDNQFVRFPIIGNDYAGKDRNGDAREVTTSVYFVAFGATAKTLAEHVRKGDQVIVQARIQANNWTDENREKRYDLSFVVESFKFGRPGKETREILARNAA